MAFEGFDGHPYTQTTWAAHVASIPKSHMGFVRIIVLHNSGSPTLKQWKSSKEQQRIFNLRDYYKGMGWHQGPHAFIDDEHIWGFSPLTAAGVHASCFNHFSLGLEMALDAATEPFDSGDGAKVRDNAVFALATLYNHLGLHPDHFVYGKQGLHFHKNCVADHHDCPGKHVDYADMVKRVSAKMRDLNKLTPLIAMTEKPKAPVLSGQHELSLSKQVG